MIEHPITAGLKCSILFQSPGRWTACNFCCWLLLGRSTCLPGADYEKWKSWNPWIKKCFFFFQRVPGVASTMVGYTAGSKQHPSYNEASSHTKQPATKSYSKFKLPFMEWSFTGWFSINPHGGSLQIGVLWIHWSHWGRPDALQPWLGLGKCCYKPIFLVFSFRLLTKSCWLCFLTGWTQPHWTGE